MNNRLARKKRWFFALCRELGYNVEKAKSRAKLRFKLDSFAKIEEHQIDFLIDKLLVERDRREEKKYG